MKTLRFILIASIVVSGIATTYAQTVDENHKNLSKHHETIIKNTTEVTNGTAKDVKKNTEETGTNLENAQKQHAEIQAKQSAGDKNISQQHHEIIAKNHANALRYNESIKQELAKPNPDKAKIRQNSLSITNEVNEAKKHHEEIKKKTGK
jgi:hypothetical protein